MSKKILALLTLLTTTSALPTDPLNARQDIAFQQTCVGRQPGVAIGVPARTAAEGARGTTFIIPEGTFSCAVTFAATPDPASDLSELRISQIPLVAGGFSGGIDFEDFASEGKSIRQAFACRPGEVTLSVSASDLLGFNVNMEALCSAGDGIVDAFK